MVFRRISLKGLVVGGLELMLVSMMIVAFGFSSWLRIISPHSFVSNLEVEEMVKYVSYYDSSSSQDAYRGFLDKLISLKDLDVHVMLFEMGPDRLPKYQWVKVDKDLRSAFAVLHRGGGCGSVRLTARSMSCEGMQDRLNRLIYSE